MSVRQSSGFLYSLWLQTAAIVFLSWSVGRLLEGVVDIPLSRPAIFLVWLEHLDAVGDLR
jgi:hypothetical protein